jgi:hypothetical protein
VFKNDKIPAVAGTVSKEFAGGAEKKNTTTVFFPLFPLVFSW